MSDDVIYRREDQVGVITLNRPSARNAFSLGLRDALLEAVKQANAEDRIRAVIIEGAGDGFSSGADLFEELPDDFDSGREIERVIKPMLLGIMESPKPYIAAVNGGAVGIGCGLALACDMIVMTQDAYMLFAFAAVGLSPDGGTSWQLVQHVGPKRAFEILTSGERLTAESCFQLGLASRIVEPGMLGETCRELALRLVAKPIMGVSCAKKAVGSVSHMDVGAAISMEAMMQSAAFNGQEFRAARLAFSQKKGGRG